MGGRGSGRPAGFCRRATTDDFSSLDVRWLKRQGLLKPGLVSRISWRRGNKVTSTVQICTESNRVILGYRRRFAGEWEDMSYPVELATTNCHLGGERQWFICPNDTCSRRAALLYGSGLFACRQCLGLTYGSQREPNWERGARKIDRVRDKLGWEPGLLNEHKREKPKGMHWVTFARLTYRHDALAGQAVSNLKSHLERYQSGHGAA